jgi:exopolysaccharide production protein ExoZ
LSIQYLRGAAALAVTTFHALQWCDGGFEVGRAGVDVFFIISGVIMWRVTCAGGVTPFAFLARRATRVAPLYWIMTLTVWALALWWRGFLPEVLPGAGHLLLSLAFIPHYDPLGRAFPTLPPGWTLTYEAAFYVVFSAALCMPVRWRALTVTLILCAIVGAGFVLTDPAYALGANPMMLQFVLGVWLGVALESDVLPSRAWGVGWFALGLAAFAGLQATGFIDELWRPLIWGLPAALLVGGALTVEARGGVFRSPALQRLGDASYSLYLVHLPATAVVAHTLGWSRPWLFVPVALVVSVAAALACHAWIEQPLIRLARRGPIDAIYRRHVINRLDGRSAAD